MDAKQTTTLDIVHIITEDTVVAVELYSVACTKKNTQGGFVICQYQSNVTP